jgi:hypothetical protein
MVVCEEIQLTVHFEIVQTKQTFSVLSMISVLQALRLTAAGGRFRRYYAEGITNLMWIEAARAV